MDSPRKSNQFHNQKQTKGNLDEEMVSKFMEVQLKKATNEAEELKLRYKQLEGNARLAEKSMEIQAKLISSRPSETRKTITRLAYITGGLLIIILTFLSYCLYIGEKDIVLSIIKGGGYIITTGLGYYFGIKRSKNKESSDASTDATVVD